MLTQQSINCQYIKILFDVLLLDVERPSFGVEQAYNMIRTHAKPTRLRIYLTIRKQKRNDAH